MKRQAFVIYKYELPIGGEKEITGSFNQFLKVGEQDGRLMLWTENYLDDKNDTTISFVVVGTGWQYVKSIDGTYLKYVDTVQMSDGLVWHVFARLPEQF